MKSAFAYDPPTLLKAYKGPVLIVQGKTDIQITPDNAATLKAAKPDAVLVELDGVNHVLKVAPLDRPGNMAAYSDPSLPLAPGVAEAIAGFIKTHSRGF
jgi:pimeloyl-ACP methyl ester carboxylesterase